jgi:hypothetical protein
MHAYPMPTHQFEMAPLDEFVVTERKYLKKEDRPKIDIADWFDRFPKWPSYVRDEHAKTITIEEDEPTDCEPVYYGYKLIYVGKQ